MSTAKTPLSEIISVSDLERPEHQPGIRLKILWEGSQNGATALAVVWGRSEPA